MVLKPEFVFATCRAGSEASLKREVASRHGALLTPAFMRPQLITWKLRGEIRDDFVPETAFAAVSGFSIGMARSAADVVNLVKDDMADVHVYPRIVPEDGVPEDAWDRVDSVRAEITTALPLVRNSAFILDVILGDVGEPWFVGCHRRSASAHPCPGALPRLRLPGDAPSRAWLKMEQALAWLQLDGPGVLAGRTALELGSAPGGASWSLLQRGMRVIGVDTGIMDPRVASHPSFRHLALPAGDVSFRDLPREVDLLASDMNLHPGLVVRYAERFVQQMNPRWMILTLKMNDSQVESMIPALLQQIRRFAPGEVSARQLHANRREITVVAR
jgi:23S rRNA (cytidine2498-2'-O)-methyltransferase